MQIVLLKAFCRSAALCLVIFAISIPALSADDPVYAPLWLYQGSWIVTPASLAPGASPDHLTNDCALTGKYFACQQTVNGKIAALVVFIPADTPGHYFTNALLPDGYAGGRGELTISGDNWTYTGKSEDGGKTSYHRTRNTFTGKNRIHYEQGESGDGINWTVTGSGEEVRSTANSKSRY